MKGNNMSTRENKPGSIPPVNRNGRRNITQVRGYIEDDTSPVPLNPYIRTGLYNLATGQNVTPLLGSGKQSSDFYDNADRYGRPYTQIDIGRIG